jgi:hypothetical protein
MKMSQRESAIRAEIDRVRSEMAVERERVAREIQAVRAAVENGRSRPNRAIRSVRSDTAALMSQVDRLAIVAPSVDSAAFEALRQEFETTVLHLSRFRLAAPGSLNGIIATLRSKHGRRLPDAILKISSSPDLKSSESPLPNASSSNWCILSLCRLHWC